MESFLKDGELAIICPVLNSLDYTKQFLRSLPQNINFKLIIINNGSSDGTSAFLNQYSKKNEINIIENCANFGVSYAWNQGIKYAIEKWSSKYFFIPNNDIILYSHTIQRLIEALHQENVVMSTAFNINNGEGLPTKIDKIDNLFEEKITEEPDFSCFMISKECVEKIGYFDENFWPAYFEDNDYHYRIKLAGFKAIKTTRSVYFHFGSQTIKNDEKTRVISNRNYLKNQKYFEKKWGGLPGKETYKTPFGK
jgi:GT2 family glycosyltransferase